MENMKDRCRMESHMDWESGRGTMVNTKLRENGIMVDTMAGLFIFPAMEIVSNIKQRMGRSMANTYGIRMMRTVLRGSTRTGNSMGDRSSTTRMESSPLKRYTRTGS